MEVRNKLIGIFRREAKMAIGADNFSTDIDELGIDSLTRVRIVIAIEQEFGISVEEQEMMSLKSVQQLNDFLVTRLNNTAHENTP